MQLKQKEFDADFGVGSSLLTYRHLETDYEDDGFIYDIKTSGPQLEIGFRF